MELLTRYLGLFLDRFAPILSQRFQPFEGAAASARVRIHQEINYGMHLLDREECNIAVIQDLPQIRGRCRIFGQGGPRQRT